MFSGIRQRGVLALLVVGIVADSAVYGLEVDGIQSGSWTLRDSPILIVGDVLVPPGETLTIEPGVEVIGMGHYRITVDQATLIADGTDTAPIIMTADDPVVGWRGIQFTSASDDSVIRRCILEHAHGTGSNVEVRGGAIMIWTCSPTISTNVFRLNSSHGQGANGCGGAVCAYTSSTTIRDNLMLNNRADNGGAIWVADWGSPTIVGNIVIGNSALSSGGGIYLGTRTTAIVEHNIIIGNHSNSSLFGGGGITSWTGFGLFGTFPTIRNNLVAFNTASVKGGGIYLRYDRAIVKNNVVAFNSATRGGGIHVITQPAYFPFVSNTIIWGNMATDGGPQIDLNMNTGSDVSVTYSNIQGGWPGVGNIDADPLFTRMPNAGADGVWGTDDDDLGDLRLLAGSPSIDTGDPNFVPVPGETDLDGHARVLCIAVDMGPYEFGIGDVDCDESVDLNDYAALTLCLQGPGAAPDGPDCVPLDFDADGDVDLADVAGFQRVFAPPAP